MRTHPELVAVVKKEDRERRSLGAEKIGTHRIDIELIEQLRTEASFGNFRFTIDEPRERRDGRGASTTVLLSSGGCIMSHDTVREARHRKKSPLDLNEDRSSWHFDRRVGGAFKDIIYEIAIESPASTDAISEVAQEAELMCYAHNTLKNSVHMQTNLTLNGKRLEFRQ